jgi:hypothetical protein
MRQVKQILLVAAITCGTSLINDVSAQTRRSRSSNTSLISLAAEESVQKDIGLSGDICSKLRDLQDHLRATSQKEYSAAGISFQNFSSLSDADRQKMQTTMSEITVRLNAELEPRIQKLLSDDEYKRLKQIQLQVQGSDGLTTEEAAAALKLTAEQRAKLNDLKSEYAAKQQDLYRSENDQQERSNKLRQLASERDAKANEILTNEQQAGLAALTGPPFDVSVIRSGSRRGNN